MHLVTCMLIGKPFICRVEDTVNVLGKYNLSDPYEVVHSLSPGENHALLTNVPLHKQC